VTVPSQEWYIYVNRAINFASISTIFLLYFIHWLLLVTEHWLLLLAIHWLVLVDVHLLLLVVVYWLFLVAVHMLLCLPFEPDKKILFKKQLFDLEVKCQGPMKVIMVCNTPPYGHAPIYQI
jgi:hypothetical protein